MSFREKCISTILRTIMLLRVAQQLLIKVKEVTRQGVQNCQIGNHHRNFKDVLHLAKDFFPSDMHKIWSG